MKKYILLLLLLVSFTLLSCSNKTVETFDRSNPTPIVVNVDGDLKEIKVKGNDVNDIITSFEDLYSNGQVILGSNFFSKYENGKYTIEITSNKKVTISIELEGENQPLNLIKKKDIFSLEEARYYVLFLREGCGGCEQLKPDLATFNDFLLEYPDGTLDSLYAVDYLDPDYEASKGEKTNYIGISSYDELINDVSISTPTLMIVENGAISEYYVGATNISSFFYIEMSNIKDKIIIHNIDSPKVITVELDFIPKKYSITKPDGKTSTYNVNDYNSNTSGFDGKNMIYTQYYFNSFFPGTYKVSIFNDEIQKDLIIIIKSEFNYITVDQIFDQKEEAYYVFFLRDGCSGCNSVKPTLLKYSKYYEQYDSSENYPIYAIHRSMNTFNFFGEPEVFVGAKEYTEIKLGYYPRVVLIKNHEIVELYKNEGNQILSHFNEIMKKLK